METEATKLSAAVDRFLSSGKLNGTDPSVLAKAIDDRMRIEAQKSLKQALVSARRFARFASTNPSPLPLTGYRVLARITHMSARHADAEQAYLKARALAKTDPMVTGRIDRALIDVYMYLGNFSESRKRARSAIRAFEKVNATADVAMTRVNLGNLLHRQDKHRDAERIYAQAQAYFQSAGDELSVARCQYNRANTLVQLFDFAAAEPLYRSSRDIYLKHSFELDATDAKYGLAWLAMLRGEFHVALIELAECEAAYRTAGQPKGTAVCELDRAEVYLGLNLLTDALEASRSAEAQFRRMAHRYEQSKAALFRAKAAFGLGLQTEAEQAARRAISGFEADKNDGFLGASYLVHSQNLKEKKTREQELARARGRFTKAQLPLWQAVCDLYDAADSRHARRAFGRLSSNRAVREVPHLFAHWQTMLGDAAENAGDRQNAIRCWKRAADRLDAVRAQLPPLELRSQFATGQSSPHRKLIESELDRSADRAAAWSERYKTAGVWAPLSSLGASSDQRKRAEMSLVELAAQVAALSRQIGGVAGERGELSVEAHRNVTRLQKQVRLDLASAEIGASGSVDSIDQIMREISVVSSKLPIVQFHMTDTDVVAFVHQSGKTRVTRVRNGRSLLAEAMRQWRFILETELLAQHLPSRNQIMAEERFFAQLADQFWKPLEMESSAKRLLLLPEGDLANLPWQAMQVDGSPLIERHHFTLAPSLRHFVHACSIAVRSQTIELFEGAVADLPSVSDELRGLSERSPNNSRVHRAATRADWPTGGEARIWHYSGHANLRPDNPFYSSLSLVDGPMFAADFRLREARVGLVTLAACRSGQQVALPGEESTGLVRSLLEMGARNVIAGYWPVSDRSTAVWMNRFYEQFLSGESLAESAREAAMTVRQKFPSAYHWAAFAIHGAGE
ncbi:MAG: CHAT domain-containing protein [bacterium]|nr:CHAT domain-containing protein [bacterium]